MITVSKRLAVGLVLMLATVGILVPPAAARTVRIYHTIVSNDAFAMVSQETECRRVDAYVSTSNGKYAAQPGPVNKQGLTSLELIVFDTCAVSTAAAGGSGAVLFDGLGEAWIGPLVTPQLRSARINVTLALEDELTGRVVRARLAATWMATGPVVKGSYSYNGHVPGVGGSNTHELKKVRPATAAVAVTSEVARVSATTTDASLQQEKFRCMEVVLPHYIGESDWCF